LRRIATIRRLAEAGVPVGAMVAPVIPALNDHEVERILEAVAGAGARSAAYVVLRLPLELAELFGEWLLTHYPDRARRVLSLLRGARGGRDNDPRFGHRMRGHGPWADLLRRRFEVACRRLGLDGGGAGRALPDLDTSQFRPPLAAGQLGLF
jgi:DNA repair photolyase